MLNNLTKRILTALVVYIVVAYIILFSNEIILRLTLNFIIFFSAFEISKMCFYPNKKKSFFFICLVFILVTFSNILIKNQIWQFYILISSILWIYIFFYIYYLKEIKIYKNFNYIILFIIAFLLSSFYCAIYKLYLFSNITLLFLISLVCLSDIVAYFSGKSFGKNPFFNMISPNKTREGFIGSLLICSVFSLLFSYWHDSSYYYTILNMLISIFVVCVSAFGDLSISLIKRFSGVKDSGNILPGHGGLLDRIDSLLPASPIFLLLFSAVLLLFDII